MKTNPLLKTLAQKAKSGQLVSFTYTKDETGERSQRTVRIGVDLEKSLAKHDQKINGKGSWMSGYSTGLRGCLIRRGSETYIRGTQVCSKGGENATSKPGHRLFKISGISNLR
jgi:hypothetical protein